MRIQIFRSVILLLLVASITSCTSTKTNSDIVMEQTAVLKSSGISGDALFTLIPSAPYGLNIVPAGEIKRGEHSQFVESLKTTIINTHQQPETPIVVGGKSSNMNTLVATAALAYFADGSLTGRTFIIFGTERDFKSVEKESKRTRAKCLRFDIP